MAIYFQTNDPKKLLEDFRSSISQLQLKGKITTWEIYEKHFTHKAADWNRKAYFLPAISEGKLTFNIIKPSNANISVSVYGYYHGHLIETFLNHFDRQFSSATASSFPESPDLID